MPKIKEASLKKLLKDLKYSDDEITTIMESEEEIDLSMKDGHSVYAKEDIDTIKDNAITNAEPKRMKAAKEIVMKDLQKALDLTTEDGSNIKDVQTLKDKLTEKLLAESDVKPQELQTRFEEKETKLKKRIAELEGVVSEKDNTLSTIKRDGAWKQALPKGDTLPVDDRLLLLKSRLEEKTEGDKTYYTYKGKALENDNAAYLPLNEAIAEVYKSEGWEVKEAGDDEGRPSGEGFDSSKRSKEGVYGSREEMKSAMQQKGLNPLSKEGREFQEKALKANPKLAVVSA